MSLNREQIIAKTYLRKEEIFIPEWGDSVFIRELTGQELEDYVKSLVKPNSKKFVLEEEGSKVKLLILTIVDEDGNQIFTRDDEEFIKNIPGSVYLNLVNKALILNGLREGSITEAKNNLKNDQIEDSSSD